MPLQDSVVDTVVVGAGIAGLVTAWQASRLGHQVVVFDEGSAHAASHVAAGMLTPATEATFGEEALMRLAVASRDRYAQFITEVEADSGMAAGYHPSGTLQVAADQDDLTRLDDLRQLHERIGVKTERLTSRACRRLEPGLAPGIRGGIHAPDDHSVDPRALSAALRTAAERNGAWVRTERVRELYPAAAETTHSPPSTQLAEPVRGVRLDSGELVHATAVVVAAGAWASELVPAALGAGLRPVKGQVLRLRPRAASGASAEPVEPLVARTVRGLVRGSPVYLVPRDNGEIVLGATQEELGFDTSLTVEGVWQLLRDAHELLPGIGELEIVETCVGLRPGSPDNGPLLGPTTVPGLHLAAGHSRHGVLLAPVTAEAMRAALSTGAVAEVAAEFATTRFTEH